MMLVRVVSVEGVAPRADQYSELEWEKWRQLIYFF